MNIVGHSIKKYFIYVVVGYVTMSVCQSIFAQSVNSIPVSHPNRCGTTEHLTWLKQQDPEAQARMDKIEAEMQAWMKYPSPNALASSVIYIPVVVHVIYSNATENIPDSAIQQQIDQLNKDYSKTNTDTSKIPAVWKNVAADCGIQFCLASKDPSGDPTNGIRHISTSVTQWTTNDAVKHTAQGGDDAWLSSSYLNVWVCNLAGGLLGYTQPPGTGSQITDGVVILYSTLPGGPFCCNTDNYNMGRTATHEIGHWLNIRHTFDGGCAGTTSSTCSSQGDMVCDTPPAFNPNYGCPGIKNTCSENNPFPPPFNNDQNDMTMNYMDYTDDNCMYMFTNGQSQRMQACLSVIRPTILTSAAITCSATSNDNTILIYPNPSTGEVKISSQMFSLDSMDLKVYNAIGQRMFSEKILFPSSKINLSNSPNGMYFFEIKTPQGTITKKVIIHR